MKFSVAAATAIALAIAATTASAGVVITRKVERKDQRGEHKFEQTVMIQGHKQKVIGEDRIVIIDLDAGKVSIMRPSNKLFGEGKFPPVGMFAAVLGREGMTVGFGKAGATHKEHGYACQDYAGSASFAHADVSINECVASGAPGAKEFTEFQQAMADKLKGTALHMTGEVPDGIPVSSKTSIRQMAFAATGGVAPKVLADIQAENDKHIAVVETKTSKIEVKDLPPATFVVPADYVKREMPTMRLKPGPGQGPFPSGGPPVLPPRAPRPTAAPQ